MGFPHVKKFLREEKRYPNTKGTVVEIETIKDNKFHYYEAFIPEAKCDLIKFIMFNLGDKISSNDKDRIWGLIENYGDEKYCEASDDAAMQNAGADA